MKNIYNVIWVDEIVNAKDYKNKEPSSGHLRLDILSIENRVILAFTIFVLICIVLVK